MQFLGLSGIGTHLGLLDSAKAAVFTIDSNSGTATDGQYFSGYHITSDNPGSGTTYAISPLLPGTTGLIFSTTNGTISGTPTGVLAATPFTITENSTTGGLQAQLYILNIVGAPTPVPNTDPPQANSIQGVLPASGIVSAGSTIVINGLFPTTLTSIQIDGVPLSPGNWTQTSSSITIIMPPHALGQVSISIFDGQSPALPNLTLTYVAAVSASPTPTSTPSVTPTPTPSVTPTPTPTPSVTPTPTPTPSVTPTPTPTPSVTPTPTPSVTPTPTPSLTPTPTPSLTPTPIPLPSNSTVPIPSSAPASPSPSLLASVSTPGLNVVSGSLLTDDSISGPQIQLTTQIQVGDTAAGKSASVVASGLYPGSTLSIYLYSDPQLIGSAIADSSGRASIAAVIPSGLASGDHKVLAIGTDVYKNPIQALSAFQLDPQNVVVAYVPPAQVSSSMAADQSAIFQALHAGKPLYDIKLHPGSVATVALAATSLIAVAGAGGLSGLGGAGGGTASGSGHGGSGRANQGKLASAVTKKLKGVKVDEPGIGDRSKTWNVPGTLKFDALINKGVVDVGRRSALLPRVLVDGAWARAMFGAAAIILWGLGLVMGVLSSVQVHYQALPPKLSYTLVIVALGILDSTAGALAWFAMASLAYVTGHLTSWAQLRTILGMFVLFATIILLAHAIRPLRRRQDGSWMQRFDRLADYGMPPIFLAFAASSMFKALNGLSGLQLVSKSDFGALRLTVIITFLVRLLFEDIALHWYPQRSIAAQPAKLSSPTKFAAWSAIVFKLLIFLVVAAPFFGLGFYTMLAWEITGAMLVLKLYEDKLPNFVFINKWYPRGVANFLLMLVIGIFFGAFIVGSHPTHQKVIDAFALMMIPGAISTILDLLGREGWKWPENWEKRVIGAELWFIALGLVVGFITL